MPPQMLSQTFIVVSFSHPGGYSAILRGAGDTTGMASVEVYGLN